MLLRRRRRDILQAGSQITADGLQANRRRYVLYNRCHLTAEVDGMDPRLNQAVRSRRRLQFSLRSLLVLVLGCGLACGWFVERMNTARRQREAVRFL
jgi:hypothetical protein